MVSDSNSSSTGNETRESITPIVLWLAGLLLGAAALAVVFWDGISVMVSRWDAEEYSHGPLIPLIAAVLIWQRRAEVAAAVVNGPQSGRWVGVLFVTVGLVLGILGKIGTFYTVIQIGFLLALAGVALFLLGWRAFKIIWVPILYLGFMIPMPSFLQAIVSAEMQLISSRIGVALIRLSNIPVFLEGNVIDLGFYKLQVVEACSGLRYLFPLMSFGFLCAYLYRGRFWERAVLFLSTIPITILMNSIRIGVIGVLVENWGIEQAEGFLHYFEGWIIFMVCLLILFAEVALLVRISRPRRKLFDALDLDLRFSGATAIKLPRHAAAPWIAGLVLLALGAGTAFGLSKRTDTIPPTTPLVAFPMEFNRWAGQPRTIGKQVLSTLKLTDYVLADFALPGATAPVNFYVAYYASQRDGAFIHSPQTCIPGGGWLITQLTRRSIADINNAGEAPLNVNRAVISKGQDRQLVYYWFQQRGRNLTNEYLVKWYIFWDALTRNRTDGALVRLVTPISRSEGEATADQRLERFVREVYFQLADYVPN